MPSKPADTQPRSDWSQLQSVSSLRHLLDRAQRLSDASLALRAWLDQPWARHLRIANLRGDTIMLYSSNASALIPLRQQQGRILAFLSQQLGVTLSRLEAKVRPESTN
jgi:hypothetical protein